MEEKMWENIPRAEVPWYPTVNVDMCSGCQTCWETCPSDVYDWDDSIGNPVVARPNDCVVYCIGCTRACPEDAITFPNKDEVVEVVKQLRLKYAV